MYKYVCLSLMWKKMISKSNFYFMLYEKSFKIQILQKLSTNEPPRSLENFPEGTKDLVCDIPN